MAAAHCQLHVFKPRISAPKSLKWHLSNTNIISFLKPPYHFSSTTFTKLCCSWTPLRKPVLLFNTSFRLRDVWQMVRSLCFNNVILPQAFVIYFCCLALVAEGLEYNPASFNYACEDVNHYYAALGHSKGEALKKKLHSIISNHKSLPYREVWNALKVLDACEIDMPEASPGIVEIYSLRVVPKALAGKLQGWNRCLKPANKEAAPDTVTDNKSWTPPMQMRGDIARALMYMAVRYGYHQSGDPGLQLSDTPNIGNREMGILSTLLRWNRIDPPSREEKLRNERVCKIYQHNRNPFVDHPEYADLIWGKSSKF